MLRDGLIATASSILLDPAIDTLLRDRVRDALAVYHEAGEAMRAATRSRQGITEAIDRFNQARAALYHLVSEADPAE